MPVCFGLQLPSFTFRHRPGENVFTVARDLARQAESLGFDSVWLMDHLYQIQSVAAETDPLLECWTGLAALAASTTKVRLGSMVASATFRNPAVLAKMTSTIDVVSNGRLIVGIGGGWCEWEHAGYGIEFPPVNVRLQRLEEAVRILKAMWTQERATFEGRHYRVQNAVNSPKPVQKPHPPILIGGSGAKVTLRITAQHAQMHNIGGGPPEAARQVLQTLRRHCQALGTDCDAIRKTRLTPVLLARDAAEAEVKAKRYCPPGITPEQFMARTLAGTPEQVAERLRAYVDAGIQDFIVSFWDVDAPETLETFARGVMTKVTR